MAHGYAYVYTYMQYISSIVLYMVLSDVSFHNFLFQNLSKETISASWAVRKSWKNLNCRLQDPKSKPQDRKSKLQDHKIEIQSLKQAPRAEGVQWFLRRLRQFSLPDPLQGKYVQSFGTSLPEPFQGNHFRSFGLPSKLLEKSQR